MRIRWKLLLVLLAISLIPMLIMRWMGQRSMRELGKDLATRTRDVLLPILLFPVVLPVILAAVKASTGFLDGSEMELIRPWLNLLIVYDIIFLSVAFMVFDYVVEE